jgi:hypothetical protein
LELEFLEFEEEGPYAIAVTFLYLNKKDFGAQLGVDLMCGCSLSCANL